jgi:hypothetical protein
MACHLEVVHASNVLNDAVAVIVPDINAEGEMRLSVHARVGVLNFLQSNHNRRQRAFSPH